MNRKLSIILALCLILALSVGCASKTEVTNQDKTDNIANESTSAAPEKSSDSKAKKYSIGVCMKTMSDTYSRSLGEAIKEKAAKHSEIELMLLDARADNNTQLSQVEELIAKKIDVLIFNPQDVEGSGKAIDWCNKAGIPVVEINTETSNKNYSSFVGSSDVEAGTILGNYVKEKLGGKGNVLLLQGIMGQSPQLLRKEGLDNTLFKEPGIKLLAEQTCDWQRDKAMTTTEDWLLKFKEVSAIVSENDDMAMGALQAVEAAKRTDIVIAAVDAIPDALKAIEEGRMSATVFQDAKGQGYKSVDVALEIAKGNKVEKQYLIPFQLVTKENLSDFAGKN